MGKVIKFRNKKEEDRIKKIKEVLEKLERIMKND